MSASYVTSKSLADLSLWHKIRGKRRLTAFDLELTARCNMCCRHCLINLPAADTTARQKELSLEEIREIVDEAVSLGALWCLVTGGEPLLRPDFFDIYDYLKRKGLLVSVFTNATLIAREHVRLFKKYPPRDIEITVYGASEAVYERVTRTAGSFEKFRRGLDLLANGGVPVRLKTMALQSNLHEMPEIARFCRERTKDYFRFDPFLHLRFDGDPRKNATILSERLSAAQIVALERSDPQRLEGLKKTCENVILPEVSHDACRQLFRCGAGVSCFSLSSEGLFRLCTALCHPQCQYDLKTGTLGEAWDTFIPQVRGMRSHHRAYVDHCRRCALINLCMWCPAHAHLETGELDRPVDYFCNVARARALALGIQKNLYENGPQDYKTDDGGIE